MRDLLHQFQLALACIIVLLVLSLCAIFTPTHDDLIKSTRENYINEAEIVFISVNDFIEGIITKSIKLSIRDVKPPHIAKIYNREFTQESQDEDNLPVYFSTAAALENCVAAARVADGHITAVYDDQGILEDKNILQYQSNKGSISLLQDKDHPLFLVSLSVIKAGQTSTCDMVIYDPSHLIGNLKTRDIKYQIISEEDLARTFADMREIGDNLFEQDGKTYYSQNLDRCDAVLVASIDNEILYNHVKSSSTRAIIISLLSLAIIALLLYVFVYRQTLRLVKQLQNYNEQLQQKKSKVEKLSNGQRDLFNIFRSLNDCWTFSDVFRVLTLSLPYIVHYRNFIMAIRMSRTSHRFEIKEVSGDFSKYHPEGLTGEKNNLLNKALLTGEAYYNGQLQSKKENIVYHPDVNSIMVIPIISKGFKWGLLAVDHLEEDAFSQQDFELMELLAAHIALHLEELDARSKLNNEADRLRSLHDLVSKMAVEREKGVVSQLITEIPSDMNFLCLAVYDQYEDDNGEQSFKLMSKSSNYTGIIPQEPATGTLQYVARSRNRQIQKIYPGSFYQLLAPIIFRDDLYGILQVIKEDDFANQDIDTIQIMVNYLAVFWELDNFIKKAEQEALVDPLTMVWNRRYIMRRVEEDDEKIKRYGGKASIAIIDLGDFKLINDRFGHTVGDEVLKITAAAISSSARTIDSVGRYGGDEFIVLFPNTSLDQARIAMQRISEEIRNQKIPDIDVEIFADFGVACCPEDTPTLLEAINIADERMYTNKRKRKGEIA